MKSRKLERMGLVGLAAGAFWWLGCAVMVSAADIDPSGKTAAKGVKENMDVKNGPAGENSNAAKSEKVIQETGRGLGSFGKLLPLGQKNRDVKIPSFRDGNPSSFIRAATMTRLDDEKMEMERLDIRMYGETEERDMRIMLPTATYHMVTEVISSEDRSRISRKDFDLQGDTLIFDTHTQQGKMTGNIHMIIHDADAFGQKPVKTVPPAGAEAVQPKTPAKLTPSGKKK